MAQKTKPPQFSIIIEGIPGQYNQPLLATKVKRCKQHVTIVKRLPKGGVLVQGQDAADLNRLVKEWPADAFKPGKIKIHLPGSKPQPKAIVVRGVHQTINLESITQALDEQDIPHNNIQRIISKRTQAPTNLIRIDIDFFWYFKL